MRRVYDILSRACSRPSTSIDWVIIAVYLAGHGRVGIYFSRKQTSLDQYLLRRSQHGLAAGRVVADGRAQQRHGLPDAAVGHDQVRPRAGRSASLSWLLALSRGSRRSRFRSITASTSITVYEYLEARFDVRVRTLAAMIFILWRLGWMATAMYVPSLAINAATGGQVDLNTMTIVVGVLVTLYTMLGGIQAVIWNDVVQFCIMFGGLAATVAIVWSSVPGGFGEIWSVNAAAGKLDWWPPLVDPAATGFVRADRELLSTADDAGHAAGGAGRRPHGAVHQRSGDGAAAADHAIAARTRGRRSSSTPPAMRCG